MNRYKAARTIYWFLFGRDFVRHGRRQGWDNPLALVELNLYAAAHNDPSFFGYGRPKA